MLTKKDPDRKARGRPLKGTEKKSVLRAIRLEKTLDDEFLFACRTMGISPNDGLRQAILLFIKEVRRRAGWM